MRHFFRVCGSWGVVAALLGCLLGGRSGSLAAPPVEGSATPLPLPSPAAQGTTLKVPPTMPLDELRRRLQDAQIKVTGLEFTCRRCNVALLAELLAGEEVRGLRSLRLEGNHLGVTGVRAVVASTYLESLEELVLAYNDLGDEGAEVLGNATHLPRLRVLDLGGNAIGAPGFRALAGSTLLERIEFLDVSDNALEDRAAYEALYASHAPMLVRLYLHQTGCQGSCLEALLRSPLSRQLIELGLTGVDARGATMLAASRNVSRLEVLHLLGESDLGRHGYIGPSGAKALAASPNLGHLRELWLPLNAIGDVGAEALARAVKVRPRVLGLRANDIHDRGARAFAMPRVARRLERLDLSDNRITPGCAAQLQDRLGERVGLSR